MVIQTTISSLMFSIQQKRECVYKTLGASIINYSLSLPSYPSISKYLILSMVIQTTIRSIMFSIPQSRKVYIYKTLGTSIIYCPLSPPKLMSIYPTIPNSINGHTNNNKVTGCQQCIPCRHHNLQHDNVCIFDNCVRSLRFT